MIEVAKKYTESPTLFEPHKEPAHQPNIYVVDAPCGAGKTTGAIQMMSAPENAAKRYLFVTPYLNEVDRIISESKRCFKKPYVGRGRKNKLDSLKGLLDEGKNIV